MLSQNGIEFINFIIGGKIPEKGNKIRGLNEYINLYNQQQKEKNKRAPKFKQLYKQILSDRTSISLRFEAFEKDSELLEDIESFYQTEICEFETEGQPKNVTDEIKILCETIISYDLEKIYLCNDTGLTTISQRIFGDFSVFGKALNHYYENIFNENYTRDYQNANDKKREALEKLKNKFTKQDFISIALLQKALKGYVETLDEEHENRKAYSPYVIAVYFSMHFKARNDENKEIEKNLAYNIKSQYHGVKGLLNIEKPDSKTLAQDKEKVHQLKSFLDSILELRRFIKPLYLPEGSIAEKDDFFYSQFTPFYEQLNKLTPLYNMVRNYLTQKPYSTEKIKLNFENSTLLDGWDVNKETDNTSVILRKDGLYYLAIMDKSNKRIFVNAPKTKESNTTFEKYYCLAQIKCCLRSSSLKAG